MIPALIKPVPVADLIPEIARCGKVLVAEEGVATGGWGAEVASLIHEAAFDQLEGPVRRLGARDTPIPSARTLEEAVLPRPRPRTGDLRWRSATGRLRPAGCPVSARSRPASIGTEPGPPRTAACPTSARSRSPPGAERDSVLVARWLVADGERVRAGQPVCDVETTKTAIARKPGLTVVLRVVPEGGEAKVGSAVALIGGDLETLRAAHGAAGCGCG